MTGPYTLDASSQSLSETLSLLLATPEHLAFFLAEPVVDGSARCVEQIHLDPHHVDRSLRHVGLTDSGRAHVLRHATDTERWLVEMHAHGKLGDPAEFSLTDRTGLSLWVPHVRWRLPGSGYIALVFGNKTVDGLVWLPDEIEPLPIDLVRLPSRGSWKLTGRSFEALNRATDE